MTRSSSEARRIWTAPALIAVATLISLIGALITEDNLLDGLAAVLLLAVLTYATVLGLRSQ